VEFVAANATSRARGDVGIARVIDDRHRVPARTVLHGVDARGHLVPAPRRVSDLLDRGLAGHVDAEAVGSVAVLDPVLREHGGHEDGMNHQAHEEHEDLYSFVSFVNFVVHNVFVNVVTQLARL
jgi:hypothetical protein